MLLRITIPSSLDIFPTSNTSHSPTCHTSHIHSHFNHCSLTHPPLTIISLSTTATCIILNTAHTTSSHHLYLPCTNYQFVELVNTKTATFKGNTLISPMHRRQKRGGGGRVGSRPHNSIPRSCVQGYKCAENLGTAR